MVVMGGFLRMRQATPAAIAPTARGLAAARSLISAMRRSARSVAASFTLATMSSRDWRASPITSSLKLENVSGARRTSRSDFRRRRASAYVAFKAIKLGLRHQLPRLGRLETLLGTGPGLSVL